MKNSLIILAILLFLIAVFANSSRDYFIIDDSNTFSDGNGWSITDFNSIVTHARAGSNVSISCSGSDQNGDCLISSTASGGSDTNSFTAGIQNPDNNNFLIDVNAPSVDANQLCINGDCIDSWVDLSAGGGAICPTGICLSVKTPNSDMNINGTPYRIKFTVSDANLSVARLDANIYYSLTAGADTNLIVKDLNLLNDANCEFIAGKTRRDYNCWLDWNIPKTLSGKRYFIDINVTDGIDRNSDSSDNSFGIDSRVKWLSLETLDAPVFKAISDGTALDGNLVPGSTWYFRVVAVKGTTNSSQYVDSAWMPEVAWTVSADKNSIDLNWNAVSGANRYYVLATQVSGDYSELGTHNTDATGAGQSGTNFTWKGNFPTPDSYYGHFWYRPSGVPNIIVEGGTSSVPLTFDDIYNVDNNNGWNRVGLQSVKGAGTEPFVEYTNRKGLKNSFVIDATLTFGRDSNVFFKQLNADILLLGGLYTDNNYTKLFQLGTRSGNAMGAEGCELRVRGTTSIDLQGTVNIYASSLITESQEYAEWVRATTLSAYSHTWKKIGLSTNASASVSIVSSQIYGRWSTFARNETGTDLHNSIIGSYNGLQLAAGGSAVDAKIAQGQAASMYLYQTVVGTQTFRRVNSLNGNSGDLRWEESNDVNGINFAFVDNVFQSKGQTNNDPYFNYCRPYATLATGKLIFAHAFNPVFIDINGALLKDYNVLLTDKDGNAIIIDYTDANGYLHRGSIDVNERFVVPSPTLASAQSAKYLSWMIASGYLIQNVRNPHTLVISKNDVNYAVMTFDINAQMNSYVFLTGLR
jgi:hypothetical protein